MVKYTSNYVERNANLSSGKLQVLTSKVRETLALSMDSLAFVSLQ